MLTVFAEEGGAAQRVASALGAGWRAIWFGRRATAVNDPRVAIARDAADVRAILATWLER